MLFSYCTSLTSITIPDSVTSIGTDAFIDCTNLTIYCNIGSYAETYAIVNSIPYEYMSSSIPGDANGDGVVNTIDISNMSRSLTNGAGLSEGADVNGDGFVGATDLSALIRQLSGAGA